MTIRCGNRAAHAETTYHATVESVRACHRDETWACTWLEYERDAFGLVYDEDGRPVIRECRALAWTLPDGRGYTCERGHEHIDAEVRDREGWDYVDGPEEARRLAKVGVASVGMDGKPILV